MNSYAIRQIPVISNSKPQVFQVYLFIFFVKGSCIGLHGTLHTPYKLLSLLTDQLHNVISPRVGQPDVTGWDAVKTGHKLKVKAYIAILGPTAKKRKKKLCDCGAYKFCYRNHKYTNGIQQYDLKRAKN